MSKLKGADTFKNALKECFGNFFKNYPEALEFKSVRHLHKTRVSLRKLLTLLSFLQTGEKNRFSKKVSDLISNLKRIQKELGRVRDSDVRIQKLDKLIKESEQLSENFKYKLSDHPLVNVFKLKRKVDTATALLRLSRFNPATLERQFENVLKSGRKNFPSIKQLTDRIEKQERGFKNKHTKLIQLIGQQTILNDDAKKIFHKVRLDAKLIRYSLQELSDLDDTDRKTKIKYYKSIQDDFGQYLDLLGLKKTIAKATFEYFPEQEDYYANLDRNLQEKMEATMVLLTADSRTDVNGKASGEDLAQNNGKPSSTVSGAGRKNSQGNKEGRVSAKARNNSSKKSRDSSSRTIRKNTKQKKDNLKLIRGIGPRMEKMLNAKGIKTFVQISMMKPEEFKDLYPKMTALRIWPAREDWPGQAKAILLKSKRS